MEVCKKIQATHLPHIRKQILDILDNNGKLDILYIPIYEKMMELIFQKGTSKIINDDNPDGTCLEIIEEFLHCTCDFFFSRKNSSKLFNSDNNIIPRFSDIIMGVEYDKPIDYIKLTIGGQIYEKHFIVSQKNIKLGDFGICPLIGPFQYVTIFPVPKYMNVVFLNSKYRSIFSLTKPTNGFSLGNHFSLIDCHCDTNSKKICDECSQKFKKFQEMINDK